MGFLHTSKPDGKVSTAPTLQNPPVAAQACALLVLYMTLGWTKTTQNHWDSAMAQITFLHAGRTSPRHRAALRPKARKMEKWLFRQGLAEVDLLIGVEARVSDGGHSRQRFKRQAFAADPPLWHSECFGWLPQLVRENGQYASSFAMLKGPQKHGAMATPVQ